MKDIWRKRPGLKTLYVAVALACLVSFLVVVLILCSGSPEQFAATRIVDFPPTVVEHFVWLDDHTILYTFRNHDTYTWRSFDVNDGSAVTLNALADTLQKNGVAPKTNRGEMRDMGGPYYLISPSRKWLFVQSSSSNGFAINLGEFTIVRPKTAEIGDVYWLSNDRGWVDFVGSSKRGHNARITWLQSNATEVVQLPFKPGFPIGVRSQNDHLLMLASSTNNSLVITEASFLSDPQILEKTSIPMPPGSEIHAVICAADGSKVAWFQTRPRAFPSIQFSDSFPYVDLDKKRIWSLVVYDVQTHKAQSLGDSADFANVTDLQWTVDNRNITYEKYRRLYIVKVGK